MERFHIVLVLASEPDTMLIQSFTNLFPNKSSEMSNVEPAGTLLIEKGL